MRSVVEIRDHLLEDLSFTVFRPSMRSGTADATEMVLLHLLCTLAFIDGREQEWADAKNTYIRGCRRVCGQFEFQHRPFPHFVNEVASVYAEVAFKLGYLRPVRLLRVAEMRGFAATIRTRGFRHRVMTEENLLGEFGPPSHEVVGGFTKVACYGCEDPTVKWVFFDLARQLPWVNGWLSVPMVRDFRHDVQNRMRLLPIGLRWVKSLSAEVRE
ncbi:hypothetical protein TA3x_003432 [Tundrisphaera sp. TA3]|uniref:hypothetical protein n=1 Tax=Tundrisphaera sp. TA3 TaxID=3435775 RepID=UPI003EB99077